MSLAERPPVPRWRQATFVLQQAITETFRRSWPRMPWSGGLIRVVLVRERMVGSPTSAPTRQRV